MTAAGEGKKARDERLVRALRDNLRRRKAAARDRPRGDDTEGRARRRGGETERPA